MAVPSPLLRSGSLERASIRLSLAWRSTSPTPRWRVLAKQRHTYTLSRAYSRTSGQSSSHSCCDQYIANSTHKPARYVHPVSVHVSNENKGLSTSIIRSFHKLGSSASFSRSQNLGLLCINH